MQTSHADGESGGNSRARPSTSRCQQSVGTGEIGPWQGQHSAILSSSRADDQLTSKVIAYLVKYFKTGIAKSVDQPLDTVTGKHRFGLVLPDLIEFSPEPDGLPKHGRVYLQIEDRFFELELKLRMLEPQELASAQGFRKGYQFIGTKTAIVKQIGNAVPRRLARAIVAAAFTQNPDAPEAIWLWEENQPQQTVTKLEEEVAA